VFEEAVTSGNPFAYGFRPAEDGAYFRNGGSFLGWGLGASVGAKMAAPDRLVVAVVGDGSFIFGAPVAALWTARRQGAPVFIVVVNNAAYNSVRLAVRDAYPTGVQARSGFVGVDLVDPPAFETVAASVGAWGQRVERHEELEPTLREALEIVRGGRTALVNVLIEAAEQPL
jgi:acetolactate synthase-1/2/3 large subunit